MPTAMQTPVAASPYDDIDAPMYADLSATTDGASPSAAAWFPAHARETVQIAGAPPVAPQPFVEAPAAAPAAPPTESKAARVPAVASKPTKSSQAWTKPAAPPAPSPSTAKPTTKPAAPTKPMAPTLSTARRQLDETKPVLSTEERQLQAAARDIRANKQQRDKWRNQLDKVLAEAGTKLPARSTAALTVPVEFNLTTAGLPRSAPASPASSPRKASATPSSRDVPHKPLAEQVVDFTKTPKRFRGKAPGEPAATPSSGPLSASRSAPRLAVTAPKAPELRAAARAAVRPTTAKSRDEMEAEMMESMPKFRALPLNKAVLASASAGGTLGVPKIERAKPTQPKEFLLSSGSKSARNKQKDDDASSDAGSTASAPAAFKARPFNKKLMEGRASGITQITPRKTTLAKSPKLSTSNRAKPDATPKEEEEFASFKARPMPDMSSAPSPLKGGLRSLTSPQPFALSSVERHELAKSDRERHKQEQAEAEAKLRQFKARPMVLSAGWKPDLKGQHTAPREFALQTNSRSDLHQEAQSRKAFEAEAAAKRAAAFKAKPALVLAKPAFAARKSDKPLTEIANNIPFTASVERQQQRKVLEEQMAQKRARMEHAAEVKAKADAVLAAKEITELRKAMVPKARKATVLGQQPFVVSKAAAKPVTQPVGPTFATDGRSGLRRTAVAA